MSTPLTDAQRGMLEDLVFMAILNGIPLTEANLRDDLDRIYEDVWQPNQTGALDVGLVSDKDLAAAVKAATA